MGDSHQASTLQLPSLHGAYLASLPCIGGNSGDSHQSSPHDHPPHYPHATGSAFHANNDGGVGHQCNLLPPSPHTSVNSTASMASAFAAMHAGVSYNPHARNRAAFWNFWWWESIHGI